MKLTRLTSASAALLMLAAGCRSAPPDMPEVATVGDVAALEDTPQDTASEPADARDEADDQPMRLSEALERGTLDNGLTYYIMRHQMPAKRAALWLAVNAGSMLEEDDQRGLAHLIEHMAFEGTTNFGPAAIVDYLEKIGMRFGADTNAYTTFEETVYQLLVPTDDPAYLEKGLQILREWASEVTFDPAELEQERGVVLSEWRQRKGPHERLQQKQQPVLFAGTRYLDRLPIGSPDVIQSAPRDALVRFYRDWYRPDLMAVIVVGDVDGAWVRDAVARRFADLKPLKAPRPRVRAALPADKQPTRVSIETDPELTQTTIAVYDFVPHRPEATTRDLRRGILEAVYSVAMEERFQILARRAATPFIGASVGSDSVMREIDAFTRSAVVKGQRCEDALRSLFTEVARVERHGFSAAELERARAIVARFYEDFETRRATLDSSEYASEITRNFFEGEFIIGPAAEAAAARAALPTIGADELARVSQGFAAAGQRVILIAAPAGTTLPSQERVLALIDEVATSDIAPWQESSAAGALMPTPPKPGTIVSERRVDAIDVTVWRLSNGAEVYVKPTDFDDDHFALLGTSPGGLVQAAPEDVISARMSQRVLGVGGVGELDATALDQVLAGRSASASTFADETREGVTAGGATEDLEVALQLLHLRITAPRRDDDAIAVLKDTVKEAIQRELASPLARFGRELRQALYGDHPLARSLDEADIDAIAVERALAFHRQRFGDVSDFTFTIVGDVALTTLRPLVESYLASLPGGGRDEVEKDAGIHLPPGQVSRSWHIGDEPKAGAQLVFHREEAWSRDAERDLYVLTQVLDLRLTRVLREELGGVYGVSVSGRFERRPKARRVLEIGFECAPEQVEALIAATLAEAKKLAQEGPSADELEKVRQEFLRTREVDLRTNGFWLGWLDASARFDEDPTRILDPSGALGRMTAPNVEAAAARYLDTASLFRAIRLPAAK